MEIFDAPQKALVNPDGCIKVDHAAWLRAHNLTNVF
jgi:hypothetical protein